MHDLLVSEAPDDCPASGNNVLYQWRNGCDGHHLVRSDCVS